MTQEKINRINELSKKSRVSPLSQDELNEQKLLRDEFRRDFISNLSGQLDSMTIVNPDGTREAVKDRKKD